MKPTSANNTATQMAFYRQDDPASESLVYDPRVKVDRVTHDLNGDSDASMALQWLGSPRIGYDNPEMAELSEALIAQRYDPTLRCAVGMVPPAGGSTADVAILAHGYLDANAIKISADKTKASFNRRLQLRSILRRALRSDAAMVQGRYMLSNYAADALDGLPPSTDPIFMPWASVATHVAALPTIFNPDGKPNRMKRPVRYDATPSWGSYPIHLFTYDDDPEAEPWTFLQALRYLIMVYLPCSDSDSAVAPDNLFLTERSGPTANPWWSKAESSIGSPATVLKGWEEHMVRNCHSLAVDGKNLLEALQVISAQSGMRFHETHTNETQDAGLRVLSWINFWCPGDYDPEVFSLERNGSQFDDNGKLRTVDDILEANNVGNAALQLDHGNTHSKIVLVGGRKWITLTCPLVPGWTPNSRWDDVSSADRDTYCDDAANEGDYFSSNKEDVFYARFNPRGDDWKNSNYMNVGRLWCIDPAGELKPSIYNRTYGPYTNYQPWAFPGYPDAVRRRRVMRKVPVGADNSELGIILEITLDGGGHWYPLETKCRLLSEQTAIWFNNPELLTIGRNIFEDENVNTNELKNYYHAYLRGYFRLRATFQIDTDARLMRTVSTSASPLATHVPTKMIMRPNDFHYEKTASSVASGISSMLVERDDNSTAQRFAEAVLADAAGSKWKGNVNVPWIELEKYKLGTPVEGIRRQVGSNVEIEFGGTINRRDLFPCVIQKVYRADDQGTDITLHDHSLRKALAPR